MHGRLRWLTNSEIIVFYGGGEGVLGVKWNDQGIHIESNLEISFEACRGIVKRLFDLYTN